MIESLKEAGLTDGEVKVYLALLELGASTVGPVVDKAGVARSFVYHIIENLMEKGLVSYITKGKIHHYQAAQPQKLLEYIDNRKTSLEKNRKKVEDLIPELLLKQSIAKQSEANIYIGFKGIRTAHEHTYLKLKKGDEYCFLGIPGDQPETQHKYWERDHKKREKTGITCRLLFNRNTPEQVIRNRNSFKGSEARKMREDMVTPATMLIYKDTTTIIIQNEPIAIEIINQSVADSFMAYFEEFWKNTKPFK